CFIEIRRRSERFEQSLLTLRPFALLRGLLRYREPGLGRQPLDRLDKIEVLGAHQIADCIAMCAAAEAVEKALILDDVKGRGLFVMERAEAGQLAPAPDQPDVLPDQRAQRNAGTQLVEKTGRKRHPVSIPLPGLVPGIHVFPVADFRRKKDVGGRDEPGHGVSVALREVHPNNCLTIAPARARSITPAWRSRNTPMTRPISLTPAAPVSVMAVLAAAAISSSLICCGRKLSMIAISSSSRCASSGRLPC